MGFFSGITKAVGGLLGGGSSSTSQNTTVSSKQVFSPINNIDTDVDVEVNIDIDKLAESIEAGTANDLFISQQENKLAQSIANEQNYISKVIANENYKLDKDIALENSNIKLTEQQIKEEELKISSLNLKEKREQNERMTWIALAGVAITLSGVIWSNSKRVNK